jgi:hypothetical protein
VEVDECSIAVGYGIGWLEVNAAVDCEERLFEFVFVEEEGGSLELFLSVHMEIIKN